MATGTIMGTRTTTGMRTTMGTNTNTSTRLLAHPRRRPTCTVPDAAMTTATITTTTTRIPTLLPMLPSPSCSDPASPEPTSPAVMLQLMWLASPALPVGGFSYSEGLEAAVDAGRVVDESSATTWLLGQLELAIARSESPALARAHAAWVAGDLAAVAAVNDWVRTTRETRESREQGEQMGRSLVDWLRNQPDAADDARIARCGALAPSPTWVVAFALAAARAGATAREALLAHAFGWAENMVQAALKAVPLGQLAGQRVLQALILRIPAHCDHALAMPEAERQSFAPMLAIHGARHETQYSRLFRS